jgi:hypothetical protein
VSSCILAIRVLMRTAERAVQAGLELVRVVTALSLKIREV